MVGRVPHCNMNHTKITQKMKLVASRGKLNKPLWVEEYEVTITVGVMN
jgi:hypothetical protein